jgi:hypothetical protein
MKTIVKTRRFLWLLLAGAWLGTGCASRTAVSLAEPNAPTAPVQMLGQEGATTAEVIQAAEYVLTRMHFAIEKLDAEQGIVKTRPLRGAQFFEFWRSDNASSYGCQEAGLQSVRRAVELRVKTENGGVSGLRVECAVSVQRLSLPENEVAGTSEAYRIHSRSTTTLQRIEVSPEQRRAMTWIDLGKDPDLAEKILERVEQRLRRSN